MSFQDRHSNDSNLVVPHALCHLLGARSTAVGIGASSELEESLLVLPLDYVLQLLPILETLIQESREVELACRCLFFLLRIHHGQITSNQTLLPMIDRLRKTTLTKAKRLRDTIGFNQAGLQFLKDKLEAENEVQLFADATANFQTKKRKQKKRADRAILKL
eukprot:XP_011666840.1 PREDICTED: WD repeat-containing protein 3 [Strongylocentrotus purpuratus]